MMSSMSGYITYINYVAGTTKGETEQNDLFNNPFQLGDVDPRYTADRVAETFVTSQTTLGWTPVVQGAFTAEIDGVETALGDIKVVRGSTIKYGTFASADAAKAGTLTSMTFKNPDGTADTDSFALTANDKMYYNYDNVTIPQAKLPTLKAEMKSIPLIARARRIAVYYSQIAA